MRGTISFLVLSLAFGYLGVKCESLANPLSMLISTYGSQQLLIASWNPRKPDDPAPHRGSGRRELMEDFINTSAII